MERPPPPQRFGIARMFAWLGVIMGGWLMLVLLGVGLAHLIGALS